MPPCRATDERSSARSGDGSIRIERVNGRLELRTGDGSIRATEIAGELTLDTGDGIGQIDDVAGRVEVDTGDGSVSVTGKLGACELHTGDGSIALACANGTAMTEDWMIATGDGACRGLSARRTSARSSMRTPADGRVRNDLS